MGAAAASEPSMDEILASIRKIIDEDDHNSAGAAPAKKSIQQPVAAAGGNGPAAQAQGLPIQVSKPDSGEGVETVRPGDGQSRPAEPQGKADSQMTKPGQPDPAQPNLAQPNLAQSSQSETSLSAHHSAQHSAQRVKQSGAGSEVHPAINNARAYLNSTPSPVELDARAGMKPNQVHPTLQDTSGINNGSDPMANVQKDHDRHYAIDESVDGQSPIGEPAVIAHSAERTSAAIEENPPVFSQASPVMNADPMAGQYREPLVSPEMPHGDMERRQSEERRTHPLRRNADQQAEAFRSALVSNPAEHAISQSFERLRKAAAETFEDSALNAQAEKLLRPMLQEWLENNLPNLVERLVRDEIERVSRGEE